MKILFVASVLLASRGGGDTSFFNEIIGLAKKGHKINAVINSIDKGYEKNEPKHRNILIHRGPKQGIFSDILLGLFSIYLIVKAKPDIVITRARGFTYSFIIALFSKLMRIPVIVDVHDLYSEPSVYFRDFKWKIFYSTPIHFYANTFLELVTLKLADKIATVSISMITVLSNIFNIDKSKFVYIPNGVDKEIFWPRKTKEKKYILFVGVLLRDEGIHLLIKSLPKVLEENPKIKLKIVGDIRDRKYYNELLRLIDKLELKNKVEFVGRVPFKEVPKYIEEALVCVAPYPKIPLREVCCPLKLLEYMAMNKRIVCTDLWEVREITDNNITLTKDNPKDIAIAINNSIVNENLNTSKVIKEKFNWEQVAEIWEQTLKDF